MKATKVPPTSVKKRKVRVGDIVVVTIIALCLLVGVGLVAYPTFSDWYNQIHATRAVAGYNNDVTGMSEAEKEAIRERVRAFNNKIAMRPFVLELNDELKAEYDSLLNINDTGVMAYIEIPKIRVELPIRHGTSEETLQTSVGHLEGTSLPMGGPSTHVALSGHRGLTSAKLFTDLDKIETGDTFTVTVLGDVLTYQVFQIDTVLPHEMQSLAVVPGEDLVTLITCTPYGVNSHRLLIHARRIATAQQTEPVVQDDLMHVTELATGVPAEIILLSIVGLVLLAVLLVIRGATRKNRRRKKTKSD